MKILIGVDGPHAMHNQRMGFARAFQSLGHDVAILNELEQSQIEIITRFKPELAILNSYNLNNDGVRALKEVNSKAFLRVFDDGPQREEVLKRSVQTGIDYKIEFATTKHIRTVESIANNGNLLGMFNHYHEKDLDQTLGYWKNIGPVFSSMLAADTFLYGGAETMREFNSDCCFIGSYHPYKAINLNPFIVNMNNLIKDDGTKIKCKIFSTWAWPSEYYCGVISQDYNKVALKSSKVGLNVSEPHSTEFGTDVIERIFYNLWMGNFLVSDKVDRAVQMFGDSAIWCSKPDEFHESILHFLRYPDEAEHYKERAKKSAESHTYINRVKDILNIIGN